MKTVIWKGIYYNSLEYFQLAESEQTITAISRIIGTHKSIAYFVHYNLKIGKEWNILNFEIEWEVNNHTKKISGAKENNEWTINNKIEPHFQGFQFIDISLSPFTNTLPINNLHLNIGQQKEISVIYIDILEDHATPAGLQLLQFYRQGHHGLPAVYECAPRDLSKLFWLQNFI